MSDKLFEIEDQVAELKLRAEALKALTNVFGDAFATSREPEELAQAIRNRPSVYQHLWYLIVDIIDKMPPLPARLRTGWTMPGKPHKETITPRPPGPSAPVFCMGDNTCDNRLTTDDNTRCHPSKHCIFNASAGLVTTMTILCYTFRKYIGGGVPPPVYFFECYRFLLSPLSPIPAKPYFSKPPPMTTLFLFVVTPLSPLSPYTPV